MTSIEHTTYVAASPREVFDLVATGEGWSRWFARAATIDPRPGGGYRFEWAGFGPEHVDLVLEGRVTAWEPGEVFAFEWDSGAERTAVTITVEPRGDGTIVRVEDAGYGSRPESVRALVECAVGWGEALTLLKFFAEHGVTYGEVPPPAGA